MRAYKTRELCPPCDGKGWLFGPRSSESLHRTNTNSSPCRTCAGAGWLFDTCDETIESAYGEPSE